MSTPERRTLALLYAELRNFTRLSEVLDPARVMELANEFFSHATALVSAANGRLVAVHNDSILAVFDVPQGALATAQALQREFPAIGERWKSAFGLPAAVALGAHFGSAVLGMAGPARQQQYVAFGDSVSIAERLVHRARAAEIVLSQDFLQALGITAESIRAAPLPPLELPRRPKIALYGILLDTALDFTQPLDFT